jgi:hypothetical membrane protein
MSGSVSRNNRIGGLLLFLGIGQFLLFLNIAAFVDKGYSISNNTISHLGIDSTAYIFDATIIVLGILEIVSGLFLRGYSLGVTISLILSGIGAAGVGIFDEHFGFIHLTFALFAFLFAAITSFFVLSKKRDLMAIVWAILGAFSLVALILFTLTIKVSTSYDLGLGVGGIERLILIPNLIWAMAFGGSLYSNRD